MIDLHGLTSDLLLAGDARRLDGHARALQRDAAAGRLSRIAHGAYVDAARWSGLPPSARFLYRIAAADRASRTPLVFSHAAAAALWGLPWWGAPPPVVDVTDPRAPTSRTQRVVRLRRQPLDGADVVERLGVRLTGLERTCADVLLDHARVDAAVVVDGALHGELTDHARIAAALDGRPAARSQRTARRTLELCDPGAASAGESVSRVLVHGFGFPLPVLQQPWRDTFGLIGFTDMWWPGHGVVGEYDGDVKYLSDTWRRGRSPEQVVKDEKDREDRLRAKEAVRAFVRWGSDDIRAPERLRTKLLAAGLPLVR